MRHGFLTASLLSATLVLTGLAAAQAPGARPDPRANAALNYWQAFAFLPALDRGQETALHDWNTQPLDAAALELVGKYQMGRVYLHRGANVPRCDWARITTTASECSCPTFPRRSPWRGWPA